MSEFPRSNYNREDPRLSRQNSATAESSAGRKSPTAVSRDPRTRTLSASSWDASAVQNNPFSQPPMQASYQHLQQPPNMYNNTNQYPTQQPYYTGYENYNYNPYQYNQQPGQYITGAVQPGPPGEDYPQGGWAPVAGGYQQPPPAAEFNHTAPVQSTTETAEKTKEGVAEELSKQKASLLKERETYEERAASLRQKLKLLVDQKEQLSSKDSADRETLHIIKENSKLQVEIQGKIKDASNVIDILSGLIGDKKKQPEGEHKPAKSSSKEADAKVNFKHYDPEIHWCRMCDVFPTTARDLLLHLHSKDHQAKAQEESPWHKLPAEPKFPSHEGGPVRRLPIKGLQFFVASTAWYCRLCDCWIGDLHCASQHLMSIPHAQNYGNFVEQNPHWEIEWLKDRDKAQERVKRTGKPEAEDDKTRLLLEKYSPPIGEKKDKKKKKRSKRRRRHSSDSSSSSSSSSSSEDDQDDKSKSIRVAMRNKIKLLESEGKWDLIGKLVEERKRKESLQTASPKEDTLISQWMTISEPPDKLLMDNFKKMRQRQDSENAKLAAEREASRREKEREELERKQREKEKLEMIQKGMAEKHREKMSMKLKEPAKIKGRDNYRRHRSPSDSPERRRSRRSRSSSNDRRPNRNGRRSFDTSPHMRYEKEVKDDEVKRERRLPPPPTYKKLPFIGRMPLFKNQKGKRVPEEEKKEIQKEDYDIPRKTRFQPGNLARAYLPNPDVVHFPKLSCYPPLAPPPLAPPPPVLITEPPAPPKISVPKPPPPPKIDKEIESAAPEAPKGNGNAPEDDYNMLYEDSSSTMLYPYGNVDFDMYQQPPESFNFMQVASDIPKSHTMPLQPPPLPPDDPNDDLAMLGISSDDMAVQQMYN